MTWRAGKHSCNRLPDREGGEQSFRGVLFRVMFLVFISVLFLLGFLMARRSLDSLEQQTAGLFCRQIGGGRSEGQ